MSEKFEKIEKITLENDVKLMEVELNNKGDSIILSGNDGAFFHRFSETYNKIVALANDLPKNIEEIEEKYEESSEIEDKLKEIEEIARAEIGFSKEAEKLMDALLGNESTRKYFSDVYEDIPDFAPDSGCFIDFMNKLVPVIERIFEQKLELINADELKSKKRMEKYQPQDHKRPQK